MEQEKTIKYKSLNFAKRIVKLYKYLNDEKKEYVLSKQLLRSGTSVGANIVEAESVEKIFYQKCILHLKNVPKQIIGLNYYIRVIT